MIARTVAARAAASVVLAGALVVGTTGCAFVSTQATLIQYDPSDGVGVDVGNVHVRNVIALINEDASAVSLMITLVNSSQRSVNMNIQYESDGVKTTVTKPINAGAVARYGTTVDDTQIIVVNPSVKAGGLLPVYLQYGDNEGKQILVPVLNADHNPEYDGLFPASLNG
ncbi:MAG: hypothetical protein KF761_03805 [Salinibacterium sp.]|nr:hypothetical protein [Salinibacterium sp.]